MDHDSADFLQSSECDSPVYCALHSHEPEKNHHLSIMHYIIYTINFKAIRDRLKQIVQCWFVLMLM